MNIRFNALVSAKFAPSDLKVEALEGPNFAYKEVAMLAFFGLEQRKAQKCHLRCPTKPGSSQFLIFLQFILCDVFCQINIFVLNTELLLMLIIEYHRQL